VVVAASSFNAPQSQARYWLRAHGYWLDRAVGYLQAEGKTKKEGAVDVRALFIQTVS
jgi:hypothetical protein